MDNTYFQGDITLLHTETGFGAEAENSSSSVHHHGNVHRLRDADMRSHLTFSQQDVPSVKCRKGGERTVPTQASRPDEGCPVCHPDGGELETMSGWMEKKEDHSGRRKQNESNLKGQIKSDSFTTLLELIDYSGLYSVLVMEGLSFKKTENRLILIDYEMLTRYLPSFFMQCHLLPISNVK